MNRQLEILPFPRKDSPLERFFSNSIFDRNVLQIIREFEDPFLAAETFISEEKIPEPLSNLKGFLIQWKAFLTGSFAVKSFFPQDEWKHGDVDIVVCSYFTINLFHLMKRHGWEKQRVNYQSVEYNINQEDFISSEKYTHPHWAGTLNFIFVNTYALNRYIDEGFDIDGCTMRWNGTEWKCRISIQEFLSRKWTCLSEAYEDPFNLDINKYHKYHLQIEYERELQRHTNRCSKYITRGFELKNVFRESKRQNRSTPFETENVKENEKDDNEDDNELLHFFETLPEFKEYLNYGAFGKLYT